MLVLNRFLSFHFFLFLFHTNPSSRPSLPLLLCLFLHSSFSFFGNTTARMSDGGAIGEGVGAVRESSTGGGGDAYRRGTRGSPVGSGSARSGSPVGGDSQGSDAWAAGSAVLGVGATRGVSLRLLKAARGQAALWLEPAMRGAGVTLDTTLRPGATHGEKLWSAALTHGTGVRPVAVLRRSPPRYAILFLILLCMACFDLHFEL